MPFFLKKPLSLKRKVFEHFLRRNLISENLFERDDIDQLEENVKKRYSYTESDLLGLELSHLVSTTKETLAPKLCFSCNFKS